MWSRFIMRTSRCILLAALAAALLLPGLGFAKCYIGGEITAERNHNPLYPDWKYTAVIEWDTVSRYALSHLDILIDVAEGNCRCTDVAPEIVWWGVSGQAVGENDCVVEFETELNCNGDPSIGLEGILLKFEPIEMECEPGTIGTATLFFFSDREPAPIDEEVLLLFDKFGQLTCSGYLSGVFPALPCDPVDAEGMSWDTIKGLFR